MDFAFASDRRAAMASNGSLGNRDSSAAGTLVSKGIPRRSSRLARYVDVEARMSVESLDGISVVLVFDSFRF